MTKDLMEFLRSKVVKQTIGDMLDPLQARYPERVVAISDDIANFGESPPRTTAGPRTWSTTPTIISVSLG